MCVCTFLHTYTNISTWNSLKYWAHVSICTHQRPGWMSYSPNSSSQNSCVCFPLLTCSSCITKTESTNPRVHFIYLQDRRAVALKRGVSVKPQTISQSQPGEAKPPSKMLACGQKFLFFKTSLSSRGANTYEATVMYQVICGAFYMFIV